jgi:O-antigen ligase
MAMNSDKPIAKMRVLLLIIGVYLMLIFSGQTSAILIMGIAFIAILYALWREYIWMFMVLAIPGLIPGMIFDIPVNNEWVYEASLAEIFLVIAGAVFFMDLFLRRNFEKLKFDKISFILLLFAIVSVGSFFYISNFRLFVFGLKVVIFSFLAYLLAINLLNTQTKIRYFYYGLAFTALILSGQTFYEFYQLGWSSKFFFERNNILIPIGPIALTSAMLAFMSPIMLGLYYNENKTKREGLYYYSAVTVSILAVFLTLGKGAILSLLAGLAIIFFKTRNKVPFILFAFWFLIIGLMVFNPFFTGLFERLKTTFTDQNTDFRLLEYETGWELIKASPVYGVGIGQQLHHFPRILELDKGNYVNNYIFQALIDLGVIGLALILTLSKEIFAAVYKNMVALEQRSMLAVSFTGAFICAFLNGMVEVTFYTMPYAVIFWLVMGVYMNNMRLIKERLPRIEYSKPIV